MMHAVIIDDEIHGIKSLELIIRNFNIDVKIIGKTTDPVQAIDLINFHKPDLVFLDIQMPRLDGFELLERIEHRNFHLVFTTAYQQYGLRALKLGAADYLLKPVKASELTATLARIEARQKAEGEADIMSVLREFFKLQRLKIPLTTRSGTEYVLAGDIVYVEARSKYAKVGLSKGYSIDVASSLKDYERDLCLEQSNFLRVHNSYIVNIHHVTRYSKDDGTARLTGNKTVPVSRAKMDALVTAINGLTPGR